MQLNKRTKRIFACILTVVAFLLIAIPHAMAMTVNANDIIASGVFPDGDGIDGAPWRLYSNGALVVDSGFIIAEGAWIGFLSDITSIIFTGPITAGDSISGLFAFLRYVTVIEGLNYFDTSNANQELKPKKRAQAILGKIKAVKPADERTLDAL